MRYDVGPCRQSVQKWYYNSGVRRCETFTYGGCLGNHNNFESEEQCLTYCGNVFGGYVRPTEEPEPEPEIEGSGEVTIDATGVGKYSYSISKEKILDQSKSKVILTTN